MAGRGLALLALVCGLVAAPSAHAAVTLGTNPATTPTRVVDCIPICTAAFVQHTINGARLTAPNGVITSFAVQAQGQVSLAVYRPNVRTDSSLVASGVGRATIQGTGPGTVARSAARIPVRQGDVLGIDIPSGSLFYAIESANSVVYNGLIDQANDTIDTQDGGLGILLFSANVEADADADGYGDETQDRCATDSTAQGVCPRPRKLSLASRSVTATGGRAPVQVTNPNGFPVRGTVALKLGRRSAGKASFRLAAGASKTVRVKLARAARSRLSKKRSVKLSYRVVARGNKRTLTTTGRLTVKTKRKRSGGGGGGSALDGAYERPGGVSGASLRFPREQRRKLLPAASSRTVAPRARCPSRARPAARRRSSRPGGPGAEQASELGRHGFGLVA